MGKLVVKGMERITHLDVERDMQGDGYQINPHHERSVLRHSYSSGPYVHHYNNM